jgi:hypothetical protein
MIGIRTYRLHAALLGVAPALMLGACSQSAQDADIEQRIAAADARTAAAEKRISLATHTAGTGNGFANAQPGAAGSGIAGPPVDPAPADVGVGSGVGLQYAPYRDRHSVPNKDVP